MRSKSAIYVFVLLLLPLLTSWAQGDPPTRVGRISYLEGAVSFHASRQSENSAPADTQSNGADKAQWAPAQLNYPITTGDALWADADGRFEIQIGAAEIRADHDSEIDMAQLDDDATLLRVDQGVVNVHVQASTHARFAVMTPHGQVDLIKPGNYHVEVDDANANDHAPQVRITTLEGEAHIDTARAALEIRPGESAIIDGDPIDVTLVEGNATDFDNWALSREQREQDQIATRYVSPEMTGYADLDRAGRWADDPDYGTVWYPAVADDWAPYHYGHWAYVGPWGWTWIDDAPWGFAPFHYGRWVYVHRAWGWCPGERVVRPVYAPALVAFVGGAHWGVAVTGGSAPIGWIPLGPHEVYRPYYHASANYVRNININHVDKTVINNITINDVHENNFRNRNAVTVVNGETFTHGRPVFGKTLPVSRDAAVNAQPLQNINQIKPEHVVNAAHTSQPTDSHPSLQAHMPVPQPNPRAEMNRIDKNTDERTHGFENRSALDGRSFEDNARRPAANNTAGAQPPAENIRRQPQTNFENRERSENYRTPPIVHAPPLHSQWHPQEAPREHAPVNLPHPQQSTQIRPTPQGWQRAPAQPAAHPEPHAERRSMPQQEQQHRDRS
ncbi:MAG TPA: DUF6600 domain-containing protein [Spongiibacteraceae bacterium]